MKPNASKPNAAAPTQPSPEQIAAAMERAVQRVQRMSSNERLQSLKDAGILTRTGKLAAAYR